MQNKTQMQKLKREIKCIKKYTNRKKKVRSETLPKVKIQKIKNQALKTRMAIGQTFGWQQQTEGRFLSLQSF